MSPVAAIYLLWAIWFVIWTGLAVTAPREPGSLHGKFALLFHTIAAVAVLFLLMLISPWPGTDLRLSLWPRAVPSTLGWLLVLIAALGFVLSGWASAHHSGRLKHGAKLDDTGPYAVVRHPLYLGLIVAAIATAVIFGRPTAFLGAGFLAITLIVKVVLEERVAQDEAHLTYRARVPMLIPFWPMPER